MEIEIKDRKVELKNTFRSLIIYEEITGDSFHGRGIKETLIYFYSVIMGSDKDLNIDFDEFMDWLDENPESLNLFIDWLQEVSRKNNQFAKSGDGESEVKKN